MATKMIFWECKIFSRDMKIVNVDLRENEKVDAVCFLHICSHV